MKPILLQFGSLSIPANITMLMMGMCILLRLGTRTRARNPVQRHHIALLFVSSYVFAIAGARLLFVLEHPQIEGPLPAIFTPYPGGFSSFGGVLGAILAAVVYTSVFRLHLVTIADAASPGLCLFGASARLGCFLAGCCYGQPTSLPWGVVFPEGSEPMARWGSGVRVHPTQLYEAGCLIGIAIFLLLFRFKDRFEGERFLWVVSLYTAARFLNDFLRGESLRFHNLTLGQWISLPVALTATGYMLWRYRRTRSMRTLVTA